MEICQYSFVKLTCMRKCFEKPKPKPKKKQELEMTKNETQNHKKFICCKL